MHQADFTALSDLQETVLDTSLAVSHLWLTSSERMLALTAAATRDAFTDSATAVRALAGVASVAPLGEIWGDLSGPMLEKAVAYCRGTRDIATQTLDELARVVVDAWRAPNLSGPLASPWPDILADLAANTPARKAQSEQPRPQLDRRSA